VRGKLDATAVAAGLPKTSALTFAVVLAFTTGYALTMVPLLRAGLGLKRALLLALAADSVSVGIMEVVDNLIMLAVPGAMDATLLQPLFWGSLAGSLLVAGIAAYPVNRWLIARGKGHAVIHAYHAH
jgi:hypothetical protein